MTTTTINSESKEQNNGNDSPAELTEKVDQQANVFDLALDGLINLAERQGVGTEYLESMRSEWQQLHVDVKRMSNILKSIREN